MIRDSGNYSEHRITVLKIDSMKCGNIDGYIIRTFTGCTFMCVQVVLSVMISCLFLTEVSMSTTAVAPIISLFARRSIEQCMGEEKIRTGTTIYIILGYKFSSSCE